MKSPIHWDRQIDSQAADLHVDSSTSFRSPPPLVFAITLDGSLSSWLTWLILSRGPKARICTISHMRTRDASPWSWCISSYSHHLHTSLHSHTRHLTVLRLTIHVHMQHLQSWASIDFHKVPRLHVYKDRASPWDSWIDFVGFTFAPNSVACVLASWVSAPFDVCMRMKTCMKMVAISGYASGPGWCVSCQIVHTRTHMGDWTFTVFGSLDRSIKPINKSKKHPK